MNDPTGTHICPILLAITEEGCAGGGESIFLVFPFYQIYTTVVFEWRGDEEWYRFLTTRKNKNGQKEGGVLTG